MSFTQIARTDSETPCAVFFFIYTFREFELPHPIFDCLHFLIQNQAIPKNEAPRDDI